MKRTRQVFHYNEDAVPSDISGCRMFHGEDLRKFSHLDTQLFLTFELFYSFKSIF